MFRLLHLPIDLLIHLSNHLHSITAVHIRLRRGGRRERMKERMEKRRRKLRRRRKKNMKRRTQEQKRPKG